MRLLGDVCLIENEKLVPPLLARVSARAKQASKSEVCEMETITVVVHESMIESHHY